MKYIYDVHLSGIKKNVPGIWMLKKIVALSFEGALEEARKFDGVVEQILNINIQIDAISGEGDTK